MNLPIFSGLRETTPVAYLSLNGGLCVNETVNLSAAQVICLGIAESLPAKLDADGFRFQYIDVPGKDYLGLLRNTDPFQLSKGGKMGRY